MDWTDWTGKRIFVRLSSGKVFSGKVIEVSDEGIFIKIIDKFNSPVIFATSDIVELKLDDGARR